LGIVKNPPIRKQPGIDNLVTDKEVKVEKALLDLNELKSQMYQESSIAQTASGQTGGRKLIVGGITQTNNFFRDSAYSNG
jgi:hypothetical protein